jgi:heat shock protein HslJ
VSPLVRLGAVLCLATLALAACGGDDDADATGASLEGTQWTLVGGVDDVPEDAVPRLMLDEGTASGSGGCNNYTGPYEVDGDSITIGPLAATMMACEEPKQTVETTYLQALEAAGAWSIDGGELVLSSNGDETLRFSSS